VGHAACLCLQKFCHGLAGPVGNAPAAGGGGTPLLPPCRARARAPARTQGPPLNCTERGNVPRPLAGHERGARTNVVLPARRNTQRAAKALQKAVAEGRQAPAPGRARRCVAAAESAARCGRAGAAARATGTVLGSPWWRKVSSQSNTAPYSATRALAMRWRFDSDYKVGKGATGMQILPFILISLNFYFTLQAWYVDAKYLARHSPLLHWRSTCMPASSQAPVLL